MAQPVSTAPDMIRQLEAARKLVLNDAHVYNQILPGIIPIIGPSAALDVRRWGADFVAEGFASPALSNAQKEELCADVLPTLKNLLEVPGQDVAVVKSVIQAAASLYPLVFRRVYVHLNLPRLSNPGGPPRMFPQGGLLTWNIQDLAPRSSPSMAGHECDEDDNTKAYGHRLNQRPSVLR